MVSPISGIIVVFGTPSRSADIAIVGAFSILGNAPCGKALPGAHSAPSARLISTIRGFLSSQSLLQLRQRQRPGKPVALTMAATE